MYIGKLRQRLSIQQRMIVGSTNPSFYEPNFVWVDWRKSVPCEISVRRGREHFMEVANEVGGQRFSEDVWYFIVRYEAVKGIDAAMRILHGGMAFDIRHIRPDGQTKREMTIECTVQDAVIGAPQLSASIESVIWSGHVGEPYAGFTVTATGGTPPYIFSEVGADSPPELLPGLSIDAETGAVSGTPTTAGTWPVEIQVSDAGGVVFSLPPFDIVIEPPAGP